ncbi:histidinol-phosphate transaminase [Candidatus Marinamargulisbacteria bacterium SCGC AAA071-K20]|nr:histidinol-phosphate transaminase [Candidatus Marinamargulisbacteria bacterium SCGC AAA071-K20]
MSLKFRESIKQISEYKPGTSIEDVKRTYGLTEVIKLASNENPYGCPVSLDELKEALDRSVYYPDPLNHPLYKNLSAHNSIKEKQLVLGNGSDNVLEMVALSFIEKGTDVISSEHSFSVYKHVTQLMAANYIEVPMKDFTIDLEAISKKVSQNTRVIFIANPNNPTGTACTAEQVDTFMSTIPTSVVVVIDQAYIEFAGPEYQLNNPSFIKKYPNAVITKTFSKAYGLAGFRIGYGMASSEIISIFHKVRAPFNVNQMALFAADMALTKTDFLKQTINNNSLEKTFLVSELTKLGLTVLPSQANFLCCFSNKLGRDIYNDLIKEGIIIRSLETFDIPNGIRISIGKNDQNRLFLDKYKTI